MDAPAGRAPRGRPRWRRRIRPERPAMSVEPDLGEDLRPQPQFALVRQKSAGSRRCSSTLIIWCSRTLRVRGHRSGHPLDGLDGLLGRDGFGQTAHHRPIEGSHGELVEGGADDDRRARRPALQRAGDIDAASGRASRSTRRGAQVLGWRIRHAASAYHMPKADERHEPPGRWSKAVRLLPKARCFKARCMAATGAASISMASQPAQTSRAYCVRRAVCSVMANSFCNAAEMLSPVET